MKLLIIGALCVLTGCSTISDRYARNMNECVPTSNPTSEQIDACHPEVSETVYDEVCGVSLYCDVNINFENRKMLYKRGSI